MKVCNKCKNTKPFTDFYKATKSKDGLSYACKDCDKERRRKQYFENHAAERDKRKAWAKANTQKRSADNKRWRQENRQLMYERQKAYRLANPDIDKLAGKKWRQSNPEKVTAKTRRYQTAKINAMPIWARQKYIDLWYKIAKDEEARTGQTCNVDHIVPLRSKLVCGLHNEFNLQILSAEQNMKKGNRKWPDMP